MNLRRRTYFAALAAAAVVGGVVAFAPAASASANLPTPAAATSNANQTLFIYNDSKLWDVEVDLELPNHHVIDRDVAAGSEFDTPATTPGVYNIEITNGGMPKLTFFGQARLNPNGTWSPIELPEKNTFNSTWSSDANQGVLHISDPS